mmetsp:Transcript_15453/g.35584  ORF Transcript_15453/g.35584 Transcript_15453/m.35584 type:complete len:322 (-) Transcript_15453:67-1032(-)
MRGVLAALTALAAVVALVSVTAGVKDPVEGHRVELVGRGVRARQGLAIASARGRALSINEVGKADHLKFECEGEGSAHLCLEGVAQCVERSEKQMYELYKTSPREATELRPSHVCKCFQNNGCSPSCNVQMYLLWVTESKTQCPASPPTYVPSAGVFDYSSGDAQHVTASDISHEYFPNFPNPSGHRYYGPVPDYEYRMPHTYSNRYTTYPYSYQAAPHFAPPQSSPSAPYHPLTDPRNYRWPTGPYYYTQPPRTAFPSESNPWGGRYVEAGGDYNGAFDPYTAGYYTPRYSWGMGSSVPVTVGAVDDSWYRPFTSWLFPQ